MIPLARSDTHTGGTLMTCSKNWQINVGFNDGRWPKNHRGSKNPQGGDKKVASKKKSQELNSPGDGTLPRFATEAVQEITKDKKVIEQDILNILPSNNKFYIIISPRLFVI